MEDKKLEEAKKLLLEETQKKQKECLEEINQVLEKHGFNMQIQNQIILIPKN